MQNSNNPKGFRRFLRDNGYYLVIGLCVLAVGVSGFFLLRGGDETSLEESALSVPVTVETDGKENKSPAKQPAKTAEDAADVGEEAEEAMAELPPAETAEEAGALEPQVTEPSLRTVVAPVSGEVLSDYSVTALAYNATTRDWRTHDGIDLAAELGDPVAAAERGTVTAVYQDDYLGATVEIRHDSGYTTVYSNLAESPSVHVGQTVAAGEVIGAVGNTALLEVGQASHLHFAVSDANGSVDPTVYLSAA